MGTRSAVPGTSFRLKLKMKLRWTRQLPRPTVTAVEEVDSDEDGLTDELETALGTDSSLADSDADGVSDSDEIDFYGTDALDPDTDADGLDDAEELLTHGTNPFLVDTDGDGLGRGGGRGRIRSARRGECARDANANSDLDTVPTQSPRRTFSRATQRSWRPRYQLRELTNPSRGRNLSCAP